MTYAAAYNFLISLNNLPREEYMKDPKHCEIYFARLRALLDLLGNPEKKIPHYIHVTGTSGKGSVATMMNSILRADGRRTGLLTSPHPSIILERWEVDGQAMTKKEFVELTGVLKRTLEEYIRTSRYDVPSFSELMTVLALYYFAQKKVQWAVLEVGCGGRYDSTNVIPYKDVAVITNIGLDHTEILGKTKEQIAREKVGIIKKGARVFTAERDKKILAIIERECRKQKTNLEMSKVKYRMSNEKSGGQFSSSFLYRGLEYHLPLLGNQQIENAVLAINIAHSLKIPESVIRKSLRRVRLPIRLEVVSRKPFIILDGAHNEDKMKTTVKTIAEIKKLSHRRGGIPFGRENKEINNNRTIDQWNNVHLVIGFAGNKDIATMIRQLASLKPKSVACTRYTSNIFRKAADPRYIARYVKKNRPRAKLYLSLDPRDALSWSEKQIKTGDLLLVTGSMFLSGELRPHFIRHSESF